MYCGNVLLVAIYSSQNFRVIYFLHNYKVNNKYFVLLHDSEIHIFPFFSNQIPPPPVKHYISRQQLNTMFSFKISFYFNGQYVDSIKRFEDKQIVMFT